MSLENELKPHPNLDQFALDRLIEFNKRKFKCEGQRQASLQLLISDSIKVWNSNLPDIDSLIEKQQRKADLWDAFCSNGRIRVLGSAKLGQEGYQHMGFEIWTMYGMPEDNYDFTENNIEAIKQLETYLDAWILTNAKDTGAE